MKLNMPRLSSQPHPLVDIMERCRSRSDPSITPTSRCCQRGSQRHTSRLGGAKDHDLTRIEAKYGPCVAGDEPTEVFVVESDGKPIGLIQRYRIDDYPDWEHAVAVGSAPENAVGIDYLIGIETLLGQGLGPRIIDQFVREAWSRYPDAPAVVADVLQANRRSWRALEKGGFERTWAGTIHSDDPSDDGPVYLYVRRRPSS